MHFDVRVFIELYKATCRGILHMNAEWGATFIAFNVSVIL